MALATNYTMKPPVSVKPGLGHPLAIGLVGCWLFNERSGGRVFDSSYNNNGGAFNGDPIWSIGKFGWVVNFDGTAKYIDCGNDDSLDFPTNSFTVLARVKSSASSIARIVSKNYGGPGVKWWALTLNEDENAQQGDSGLNFAIDGGTTKSTTGVASDYSDGNWHFVVGVRDTAADLVRLYADGVEVDNSPDNTGNISNTFSVRIGKLGDYDGQYFDGAISLVMIWKRALSPSEIAWIYREQFCMFGPVVHSGLLFAPVGQVISLAGTSAAVSSVDGSLSIVGDVPLSGAIDASSSLSGTLTLHRLCQWFGGLLKIERKWLVGALFGGMISSASKLGTVLSGGWFWMRPSGCSVLYRGPSMEQMDFAEMLAVAKQDAGAISPPTYVPHETSSTYFYVVRRFNSCGYQEHTLAAAVRVVIDAEGNLAEPMPNSIFAWRVEQVDGNKIQLVWYYCPLEQHSEPACFKIYHDAGTGRVDYENQIGTIGYEGRRFYHYRSGALSAGSYLFAIRAEGAAGVENSSLAHTRIELSTASPDAVNILSAEAI